MVLRFLEWRIASVIHHLSEKKIEKPLAEQERKHHGIMRGHPFAFCPRCGKPDPDFRDGKQVLCPHCGFEMFMNVASAVGALIRREDGRILWVVRARDPGRGLLDVPGGFVDPGESLEEALCRECREELGTNIHSLKFLASKANRYPYKDVDYVTTDAYFFASIESAIHPEAEEILRVLWAHPAELQQEELAFDSLRALLLLLQSAD